MSQTDAEFRDHLIEVGRDAMGRNDGWRWWHPRHLSRLLDFWEPLIRADERRRVAEEIERLTRWKAEAIEVLDQLRIVLHEIRDWSEIA